MAKPEQFTVQQVLSREEWEGDKGTMVSYELLFGDDSTKFKAHVPADKDPGLKDGMDVEGWKNPGGKFGIATGSSNGGQRRSKGSSDDFERRPDHPQTQQRMRHTTALSAAPAYVDQILTVKAADQPSSWDDYWALVETVVAKLEATYPPASPASE